MQIQAVLVWQVILIKNNIHQFFNVNIKLLRKNKFLNSTLKFIKDTKAEHQYKVLNKLNQNLYLNPYSQNNSQNEMKILKERQEQKILNNNESTTTTTLTKGTKLKKSKSQNEVLQTTITDKGR
jgi:hypothetical protein